MRDIPTKSNEIPQCYITPHINPFYYLIDALLQNLHPLQCESTKCLLMIVKGIPEFFF